jgi:hypothetical protein
MIFPPTEGILSYTAHITESLKNYSPFLYVVITFFAKWCTYFVMNNMKIKKNIINIENEVGAITTIKGKLIYTGIDPISTMQVSDKFSIQIFMEYFNCSYYPIFYKVLDSTNIQIDGKTFKNEDYNNNFVQLTGVILPFQATRIYLPQINEIPEKIYWMVWLQGM